jgi:hypothetical protein
MDIKKIILWIALFVIILTAAGFIFIFHKEYFTPLNSWVFPGSDLTSVKKVNDTTFVQYESYGGVHNFYALRLQLWGWTKIAELGREDWTLCGGDWGGTYEKDKIRFKLHICGSNNDNVDKTIRFEFYNVTPDAVFGPDFPFQKGICSDKEIEIVNACYDNDYLRVDIKRNYSGGPSLKPVKYQVYIIGERFQDSRKTDAVKGEYGLEEIHLPFYANSAGKINKIEVTPVVLFGGASYPCYEQRLESEVKKCEDSN